jgi:hypothetical protein
MPQVSLTDYRATQEAAERQKRMAAALREQSTSPIQVQSYNGIQAPIPWAEVLAKALAGYGANRKERKADEALAEGRAKARTEAMGYLKALGQETPQDRFIAPPNFQPEQPGIIDRLKQAGQSFMPQQAPPPQQVSAPQMPPPQGAPMSAPQQPMPQGPEALPQMSDMRQIPAELQNRARSPEEQQQMLMDATMSGNPYLESIAPKMYDRNEERADKLEGRRGELQDAIILANMKPEERTAMQKDYDFATQGGYRGDFMSFLRENRMPPFISASPGENVYSTQGLAGGGGSPANFDAAYSQILKQEGGVNPDGTFRISKSGAVGPSQMLPQTGPEAAKMAGLPWDERRFRNDADYNIALGKAYYASRVQARRGDFAAAALDYHTGMGNAEAGKIGPAGQKYVSDFQAAFSGAQQPLLRGAPKAGYRPATPEEKAQYGVGADVPAQMGPEGQFQVVSGTSFYNKRAPSAVQSGYVANRKSISQIDAAIAAIKANPNAFGLKNTFGDQVNQRLDPGGVGPRAAVANIGSMVIHDRSGAAVTMSEQPRLLPFVPRVTDTPEAAIKKLQLLKEQYSATNAEIDTVFSEDAGYIPMAGPSQSAPPGAVSPRKPGETVSQYLARTGG